MRLLSLLLPGLCIAACSGAHTTIGGDDALDSGTTEQTSGDGGGGGGGDGGGGRRDGGSVGVDAAAGDGGSGNDATAAGLVIVRFDVTDFFQNCQPVVSPDPVQVKGKISVTNNQQTSVGPIAITDGAFLTANGVAIATFKVEPVTMSTISPGGSANADIVKLQGSMTPANGCSTLQCGHQYAVQVTLTAPSMPTYNAKTNAIQINCTL
jgi:hypothetical protein